MTDKRVASEKRAAAAEPPAKEIPPHLRIRCIDCRKSRLLFHDCMHLVSKTVRNEQQKKAGGSGTSSKRRKLTKETTAGLERDPQTFRCSQLLGVTCKTPEDGPDIEDAGGRTYAPLDDDPVFRRLPEPVELDKAHRYYDRVSSRIVMDGLREAAPHAMEDFFGPDIWAQFRPLLVGYPAAAFEQYTAAMKAIEETMRERQKVREKVREAKKSGDFSGPPVTGSDVRVDWVATGWTHEFLAKYLNVKTYATAVILFQLSDDLGLAGDEFQWKANFFPFLQEYISPSGAIDLEDDAASGDEREPAPFLPSLYSDRFDEADCGTKNGGAATSARSASTSTLASDVAALQSAGQKFAALGYLAPGNGAARGFSLLQNRYSKTAEGQMMMVGAYVPSGLGLLHNRAGFQSGDILRYNTNRPSDESAGSICADYTRSVARLSRRLMPREAMTRVKIMQTLDPLATWLLIDNKEDGGGHDDFGGTHAETKTHSYAVGPHNDASQDGTLEQIFFLRPMSDPFAAGKLASGTGPRAPREEFNWGHRWLFTAMVNFDLPRTRGSASLVSVASCNPQPLYHGTLPTFTEKARERRHIMHDGMGSAMLVQKIFVNSLYVKLGGEKKKGGAVNIKARGEIEAPHCPRCKALCCGECFRGVAADGVDRASGVGHLDKSGARGLAVADCGRASAGGGGGAGSSSSSWNIGNGANSNQTRTRILGDSGGAGAGPIELDPPDLDCVSLFNVTLPTISSKRLMLQNKQEAQLDVDREALAQREEDFLTWTPAKSLTWSPVTKMQGRQFLQAPAM
eukprot:g1831.t1